MQDPLQGLQEFVRQVVREELARVHAPQTYPDLLTTAEAAQLVRSTQGTIRRWIRENRLSASGSPGKHLVSRAELEQMTRAGKRARAPYRRKQIDQSPEARAARSFRR